ncbi:hypothetical protein DBR33_05720 [Stenotrophomonas sp. HMWF022]|nr:hypothetical protein DBR33_05720 [Stenotrophomonas sp. HMWF022]
MIDKGARGGFVLETAGLLDTVEQLADEIRTISLIAQQISDPYDRLLVVQVARHLEWVLGELSQRPGALSGEMPWWRDWSSLSGKTE